MGVVVVVLTMSTHRGTCAISCYGGITITRRYYTAPTAAEGLQAASVRSAARLIANLITGIKRKRKGLEMTSTKQLAPELEQIVEDIRGLRALATTTGFMTFRSQREILSRLSPTDQAAVGRELELREKRTQPIYTRPAAQLEQGK